MSHFLSVSSRACGTTRLHQNFLKSLNFTLKWRFIEGISGDGTHFGINRIRTSPATPGTNSITMNPNPLQKLRSDATDNVESHELDTGWEPKKRCVPCSERPRARPLLHVTEQSRRSEARSILPERLQEQPHLQKMGVPET